MEESLKNTLARLAVGLGAKIDELIGKP